MRHIPNKKSAKAFSAAVAVSLLLVACGNDDNNADGSIGSNNAPVTPTEQSEQLTGGNIQQGAVRDPNAPEVTPTKIPITLKPGTPPSGPIATPRRGSDGSMSNQASATPDAATPEAGATPEASPTGATPEAD